MPHVMRIRPKRISRPRPRPQHYSNGQKPQAAPRERAQADLVREAAIIALPVSTRIQDFKSKYGGLF